MYAHEAAPERAARIVKHLQRNLNAPLSEQLPLARLSDALQRHVVERHIAEAVAMGLPRPPCYQPPNKFCACKIRGHFSF